ncbi:hypothetical protein QYF36_019612 [Acer negundo]|nr:hypothetical protein QYF36_019612 [Acer negundo]
MNSKESQMQTSGSNGQDDPGEYAMQLGGLWFGTSGKVLCPEPTRRVFETLVKYGSGQSHVKYVGINYDLAAVIEKSPSYPGIEHVAGDMFTHIPNGDAIFMKWIIHHFDDERCLKILKNCYEAIPVNGKTLFPIS